MTTLPMPSLSPPAWYDAADDTEPDTQLQWLVTYSDGTQEWVKGSDIDLLFGVTEDFTLELCA